MEDVDIHFIYNAIIFALENEPSDRETELWKELQVTRVALSRAEEELRQSHADKDSFLNSLSKIAVRKYNLLHKIYSI